MKKNNFGSSWFDLSYRLLSLFLVSILLFIMFYLIPTENFQLVFGNDYSFDIDDQPIVTDIDKWLIYVILIVILAFAAIPENNGNNNFFIFMSIMPFIAVFMRFVLYSVIPFIFLKIEIFGWSKIVIIILLFWILRKLFRQ